MNPGAASPVPEAVGFSAEAYPNPFNPMVTITYSMPRAGKLSVKIFDVRGRFVRTLVNGRREAGAGQVVWGGFDQRGAKVPSGIYFFEARTGREAHVQKITLLK